MTALAAEAEVVPGFSPALAVHSNEATLAAEVSEAESECQRRRLMNVKAPNY